MPSGVLSSELGAVHLEPDPAALSVQCADGDRAAEAIAELTRSGIGIADFSLGQPSLDEVFLALTGRPAEPDPLEQTRPQRSKQHEQRTDDTPR